MVRYAQNDFSARNDGCPPAMVQVNDRDAPLLHAEGCGVDDDYLPVCEGRTCSVNPVSNARKLAAFEASCEEDQMEIIAVKDHDVTLQGCDQHLVYRATLDGWAKVVVDGSMTP